MGPTDWTKYSWGRAGVSYPEVLAAKEKPNPTPSFANTEKYSSFDPGHSAEEMRKPDSERAASVSTNGRGKHLSACASYRYRRSYRPSHSYPTIRQARPLVNTASNTNLPASGILGGDGANCE
jgi:hypothetical protein